ncbi:MAG TPA: glycosyltransferase [Pirellulales bacterium]|jgi:glycosyltransferase involved in cell wall biosynthesis
MLGVSVVIPCYNAAKYLRETLDSVLAQEYDGPLEVLVADDGSHDGSPEIVASYAPHVQLLVRELHENRSASCARNRCLRAATQPLIAFLDADDLWMPGHLSALAQAMQRRPDLGLVYDKGYFVNSDGSIIGPQFPEPHRPRIKPDDLLLEQCFVPAGVMVRRLAFNRVGVFNETLGHAEDHDMWLRVLESFPAEHVPHCGYKYRLHDGQKSLKPALWLNVDRVLAKACARYPYSRQSIRKRKAVIAYRFSEIAFRERRYVAGTYLLAKATWLDPLRAVHEAWTRFRSADNSAPASFNTMPN